MFPTRQMARMPAMMTPLTFLLVLLAGWVNRQQLAVSPKTLDLATVELSVANGLAACWASSQGATWSITTAFQKRDSRQVLTFRHVGVVSGHSDIALRTRGAVHAQVP